LETKNTQAVDEMMNILGAMKGGNLRAALKKTGQDKKLPDF